LSMAGRPMAVGTLAHEAQINYANCLRACKQLRAQGFIAQMPSGGMGMVQ
jgi:DNA-binding IclR family transcriptional regulator